MKTMIQLAFLGVAAAFSPAASRAPRREAVSMSVDRRSALAGFGALSLAPVAASAADKKKGGKQKVVVLGGSGYVGAHVAALLAAEGCDVVAASRASADAQAARAKQMLGGAALPPTVSFATVDASADDLAALLAGASAVVSCVGVVPGGKNQLNGNGAVNVRIADAAKAAGVPSFVYVSVASAISNGPGKLLFGDYVKGKAQAEAAVSRDFGASSLIIRPAIILGGPPGPPGPPGIPPVTVDAVAKTAAAGALGRKFGVLDGANEIVAAAAAL